MSVAANAQFVSGLEGAAGSTIGPGGAMYVTEGAGGKVTRIDLKTGDKTDFATMLPVSVLQVTPFRFGGAVDVAFIGSTAYVLVTGVGDPLLFDLNTGQPGIDGIYRVDGPNSYTVIADIGAYSAANRPDAFPTDLENGLQYALETYRGGLLVTDGHHNRVLWVTLDGEISEYFAYDTDTVPTGLAVSGRRVFVAQAGPVPHDPADGKVVWIGPKSAAPSMIASGSPLLVDVEFGRGRTLFALSQGEFPVDGIPAQSANENTGALIEVDGAGGFRIVADGLNLPTSLEIVRNNAYVVTLDGNVWKIDNIAGSPFGAGRYK